MERFFNQDKLIDQKKIGDLSFLVIGTGAIGSWVTVAIAKMGAKKVTAYDDDVLDTHNFDSQFYPLSSVGQKKVNALKTLAKDFGDCDLNVIDRRWDTAETIDADVVLVCVDNMDVRKTIWEHFKNRTQTRFFVEGRMSAQVYRVYGIQPEVVQQRDFYETTLYPQSEASPLPCGEKSIIYTVYGVASEMCNQVKQWIMNDYRPTEVQYDHYLRTTVTTYHEQLEGDNGIKI